MFKNERSESRGADLSVDIIITEMFLYSLNLKAEKEIEVGTEP